MTNIQMLKRKFILAGRIDKRTTKTKVELYKTLLAERPDFNPNRLP